MKKVFTFLFGLFFMTSSLFGQCDEGQIFLQISITTDAWGYETSWSLADIEGNVFAEVEENFYGNHETYSHAVCVPDSTCLIFTLDDSYGDGGAVYALSVEDTEIASGGGAAYSYTTSSSLNCPPGSACDSAIPITVGDYLAPQADTWYSFQPDSVGSYRFSTCDSNSCDTKIWIYDTCNGILVDTSNVGTIFYDDNDGDCGIFANISSAALDTAKTYLIRIGQSGQSCSGSAIHFSIIYNGPIIGCTDPTSCNYQPLATVDDGSCIPSGDPNCPEAPDLVMRQDVLESSFYLTSIDNTDECMVAEGCIQGYGQRDIIRFSTHIDNIGERDYYIGVPDVNSSQFTFDNCHNHFHYEGYAEYILFDENGELLPIGFKNGFCVLDLVCDWGIGKYGCGNMGITAGCGDIYGSSLSCQWIDVTDVPDGNYTFVMRTNWRNIPDALGQVEKDTVNNWAQVCFNLDRSSGSIQMNMLNDCEIYMDCAGTLYGSAQPDCTGECGGAALMGDVDADGTQSMMDALDYFSMIVNGEAATPCNDLNADGNLTVYDAALMTNCQLFGQAHEHPGSGQHDHCSLPENIINTTDTVALSITELGTNWIDIAIETKTADVVAFQFELSGVAGAFPTQVENLAGDNFEVNLAGTADGGVYGISYVDSLITRSTEWQPLVRFYFEEIIADMICIENITDIINQNYERTVTVIKGDCLIEVSGTENLAADLKVDIQPNPLREKALLTFSNPANETYQVKITNGTGQTVLVLEQVKGKEVEIDAIGWTPGVYFYELEGRRGVASGKFVVQ